MQYLMNIKITPSSIVRMWDDAKVIEATQPLRVFLLKEDVEGAERGNPTNCAFARAIKRSCGSVRAVFLKRTAYIELLQKDGKKRVERYFMPPDMRSMIELFDKTGECPVAGFVLVPHSKTERLEARRLRHLRCHRNALIKGTTRRGTKKKPIDIRIEGVRQVGGVRNGSGLVHFPQERA